MDTSFSSPEAQPIRSAIFPLRTTRTANTQLLYLLLHGPLRWGLAWRSAFDNRDGASALYVPTTNALQCNCCRRTPITNIVFLLSTQDLWFIQTRNQLSSIAPCVISDLVVTIAFPVDRSISLMACDHPKWRFVNLQSIRIPRVIRSSQ